MAITTKQGTIGTISGHVKLYRAVHWFGPASSGPCLDAHDCHKSGDSSPSNHVYSSESLRI